MNLVIIWPLKLLLFALLLICIAQFMAHKRKRNGLNTTVAPANSGINTKDSSNPIVLGFLLSFQILLIIGYLLLGYSGGGLSDLWPLMIILVIGSIVGLFNLILSINYFVKQKRTGKKFDKVILGLIIVNVAIVVLAPVLPYLFV